MTDPMVSNQKFLVTITQFWYSYWWVLMMCWTKCDAIFDVMSTYWQTVIRKYTKRKHRKCSIEKQRQNRKATGRRRRRRRRQKPIRKCKIKHLAIHPLRSDNRQPHISIHFTHTSSEHTHTQDTTFLLVFSLSFKSCKSSINDFSFRSRTQI